MLSYNPTGLKLKELRACPICPHCGSKKFERLKCNDVKVRCLSCNKTISL